MSTINENLAEFKDTHLGPLRNPLGRSTSTSTSTVRDNGSEASTPTLVPDYSNASSLSSVDDIKASEAMIAAPPPPSAKPGILIVTLNEGKGFSLPPNHAAAFSQAMSKATAAAGSMSQGSFRPGTGGAARQQGVVGSYTRPGIEGAINSAPTNHGRYASKYLPYALLDFDKVQVFVDAVSGSPENPYWAGDNTQYKFDVSRVTDLSVTLYLRSPNARGPGRSEDIFLGACKVKPRFEEMQADAVQLSKEKNGGGGGDKEAGQIGSEWLNLAFGTGALNIGVRFVENREKALKIEDFELLKVVGKGSFGKVMQVRSVIYNVQLDIDFTNTC